MIRRLLWVMVLLAAGAAAGYVWRDARPQAAAPRNAPPVVEQNDPDPGGPPVVWLSGTLRDVTEERLTLQEGVGPTLDLTRFAGGATRFHRLGPGGWARVPREEADAAAGQDACIEALLDQGELLAIRVFLGATCSPAVPG
ncbi:MAG TPA: hypothetical protein VF097_03865 [Actinomycetota bacterium]